MFISAAPDCEVGTNVSFWLCCCIDVIVICWKLGIINPSRAIPNHALAYLTSMLSGLFRGVVDRVEGWLSLTHLEDPAAGSATVHAGSIPTGTSTSSESVARPSAEDAGCGTAIPPKPVAGDRNPFLREQYSWVVKPKSRKTVRFADEIPAGTDVEEVERFVAFLEAREYHRARARERALKWPTPSPRGGRVDRLQAAEKNESALVEAQARAKENELEIIDPYDSHKYPDGFTYGHEPNGSIFGYDALFIEQYFNSQLPTHMKDGTFQLADCVDKASDCIYLVNLPGLGFAYLDIVTQTYKCAATSAPLRPPVPPQSRPGRKLMVEDPVLAEQLLLFQMQRVQEENVAIRDQFPGYPFKRPDTLELVNGDGSPWRGL